MMLSASGSPGDAAVEARLRVRLRHGGEQGSGAYRALRSLPGPSDLFPLLNRHASPCPVVLRSGDSGDEAFPTYRASTAYRLS
jgi:hypothetical protein